MKQTFKFRKGHETVTGINKKKKYFCLKPGAAIKKLSGQFYYIFLMKIIKKAKL